jgi:hypothetical protein
MKRSLVIAMFVMWTGVTPVLGAMETQPQTVSAMTETEGKQAGQKPEIQVEDDMKEVWEVLLVFLVLSIVFETALTPLFNWRVFMARFESKGYKTPITVILAFIVFWGYGLDIISDLLVALGKSAEPSIGGQILTALLIAGGSSGVFEIFTKLHVRMDPKDRKAKANAARKNLEEQAARKKKDT